MGIITIEKANHLFWLGRYTERVFSTIKVYQQYYDKMIDKDPLAYEEFCRKLEIENIYQGSEDFNRSYVFGVNNPDSIISSLILAYDNAVVLREEISGETLCYIELALRVLKNSPEEAPILELQKVIDYLYAFWGSVDDNVESEACRNIMKCGKYAERLDLTYRFDDTSTDIVKQTAKLRNRVKKLEQQYHLEGLKDIEMLQNEKFGGRWDYLEQIYKLTGLFEVEE